MRDWGVRDPRWRGVRSDRVQVPAGGSAPATTVHLLRAGPEHVDGAPPTLLVHGLGGASGNWLDVLAPLGQAGPVVAVDLPGFGRTAPPDPRAARLRPQARFLVRLLEALGWDRAVVHGNSMGGLLAVMLAAAAPERVHRLVLTSPALPPPRSVAALTPAAAMRFAPFVSWRLGALVLARVYATTSPEQIRRGTMDLVLGDAEDVRPVMQEVQRENVAVGQVAPWRAPAFARAAGDIVSTLTAARSVHAAVTAVRAPTLLVWGDQDRLVGRATVDAVVRRRPDWERVDLAGVGHAAMLEAPARWLAAVGALGAAPTDA